jgi:hypothetical protein
MRVISPIRPALVSGAVDVPQGVSAYDAADSLWFSLAASLQRTFTYRN